MKIQLVIVISINSDLLTESGLRRLKPQGAASSINKYKET